jgi:hypothetical protein
MKKIIPYDINSKKISVGDKVLFTNYSNNEILLSVVENIDDNGIYVKKGGHEPSNLLIKSISKSRNILIYPVSIFNILDVSDIKLTSIDRNGYENRLFLTNAVTPDSFQMLYNGFYPLIDNEFYLLKNNVRDVMVKTSDSLRKVFYRYDHTEKVVQISRELFHMMVNDDNPEDDYAGFYTKEYSLCKPIHENCLEWLFSVVAYIHDMYKFSEDRNKAEHGAIAAKQFDSYCNTYNINTSYKIVIQMKDAIYNHSKKYLYLEDNIFFDILCDADILSKYSITNIKEKSIYKYKNNLNDTYNMVINHVGGYVPKTKYFNLLLPEYSRRLRNDLKNEIIHLKINAPILPNKENLLTSKKSNNQEET